VNGAQGTVTEQVAVAKPVGGDVVLEGVARAAPCGWIETFSVRAGLDRNTMDSLL
jgi:hypothetical protein